MDNLDYKFMAISDYLNSLSDYFGTFDYYQECDDLDGEELLLTYLDKDMLLSET